MATKKTQADDVEETEETEAERQARYAAEMASERAKEEQERYDEIKAAAATPRGKRLAYAVVVLGDENEPLIIAPAEVDPANPRGYDFTKPHTLNGVPVSDDEIAHLLAKITNPKAWEPESK